MVNCVQYVQILKHVIFKFANERNLCIGYRLFTRSPQMFMFTSYTSVALARGHPTDVDLFLILCFVSDPEFAPDGQGRW